MAQFRNDAPGARAVLLRGRSYALLEPGETASFADAAVVSWPADLTRLDDVAPTEDRRAVVEAMDDDALRAFVEKLTGKKPHHKAGRAKLIEAALACA